MKQSRWWREGARALWAAGAVPGVLVLALAFTPGYCRRANNERPERLRDTTPSHSSGKQPRGLPTGPGEPPARPAGTPAP